MQTNSKLGMGLGFLAVTLALGGGVGWFFSRTGDISQVPVPQNSSIIQKIETTNPNAVVEVPAAPPEMTPANAPEMTGVSTNWEQKLDDALVSDGDAAAKAASILALIPEAPEEGKVELAQHLVNMVQDDNYTATGELLTNTNTPSNVSSVLMNDLLNRNNQLKLPMLLAVARTENHPLRSEAKDMLELFIQDDKGSNWDDWQVAVDNWLRENP